MFKKKSKREPKEYEFASRVISEGVCVYIYDEYGCSIRNYDELISYSSGLIILSTVIGRLMICGEDLVLEDSDSCELKITGRVRSTEFISEDNTK